MSIADAPVEVTHPKATRPEVRPGPGRSPKAMTALAGRIRALQQSEPAATGDERVAALAELAHVQLELERLSLKAWHSDTDQNQMLATTFALAERVDHIARLWPVDTAANLAVAAAHRPHRPDPDRKAA